MVRSGFEFTSKGGPCRFTGIKDTMEAVEIVQETFSRAFTPSARESYREENPYAPYLKQIARNVVLDRVRDRARWADRVVEIDDQESAGAVASGEPSPEKAALDRELAEILRQFMAGLSEEDRELIRVRFEDDASQEETAQRLGCDRNEVRRRLSALRKRLLRHLLHTGYIPAVGERALFTMLAMML